MTSLGKLKKVCIFCILVRTVVLEHALCGQARQTMTQLRKRCAISYEASVITRVLSSKTNN